MILTNCMVLVIMIDGNVSLMLMDMFAVGMMVVMLVHCI